MKAAKTLPKKARVRPIPRPALALLVRVLCEYVAAVLAVGFPEVDGLVTGF